MGEREINANARNYYLSSASILCEIFRRYETNARAA
jgi:hypothetical protein